MTITINETIGRLEKDLIDQRNHPGQNALHCAVLLTDLKQKMRKLEENPNDRRDTAYLAELHNIGQEITKLSQLMRTYQNRNHQAYQSYKKHGKE